ncbi:hypothetical protein FCOIX_1051 [Fusarium coicis]|nr:hypothetical protein FCOIX_1051 [Fusarium coicis]
MASRNQDVEINMPTAQTRRSKSEMKKETRRQIHEANIDWLTKQWQGPDWYPTLLRPSKPCRSVVRGLVNISERAMARKIPLSSLWEPGGCLRSVVDQDLATRKASRKARAGHPQSGRLTKNMFVLGITMTFRASADGNTASTTGDDSEVEAPEKSNTVSRLGSSAFASSAKQRLPSPLHDTFVSTKDELRDPPKGTKRALADEEDRNSNSPQNKIPRVTIDEVLGDLKSDRIETARRIMDIELDTALVVKRDTEQALIDLLHGDYSVAVTQAEKVQARNRMQEADEAFRQTHVRLHGPSQTLAKMSNLKKTFDARAVRALKLENAEKVVQTYKDRLDKAQVYHEAALKSNPIDDLQLKVVWDMFERADAHEKEVQ